MAVFYFSNSLKMIRFVSLKSNMSQEITNFIGYAASFFIVMSFVLKNIRNIRLVNLLGCICFVLYGIFNDYLWPVIIPNGILCGVQIYHLINSNNESS